MDIKNSSIVNAAKRAYGKRFGIDPDASKADLISEIAQLKDSYSRLSTQTEIQEVAEKRQSNLPYCDTTEGTGYLKFGKYGVKKKISGVNTRPFKFLQTMIVPLGAYKTVDAVFSSIWMEKDKQDSKLTSQIMAQARKVQIIYNSAIKELQKDKKLKDNKSGREIRFVFNESDTQVKAVLIN